VQLFNRKTQVIEGSLLLLELTLIFLLMRGVWRVSISKKEVDLGFFAYPDTDVPDANKASGAAVTAKGKPDA